VTEDQLQRRKTLDLYIKFRTAWVAFREQATGPAHVQLKERHDAFKPFNPDPRVAAELSAVMRFLGYGRWSGSEFERYVSRGSIAFDDLHASISAYVSKYPDDAREVISLSRYSGPPFNISAV
jgi:hypothetical protein